MRVRTKRWSLVSTSVLRCCVPTGHIRSCAHQVRGLSGLRHVRGVLLRRGRGVSAQGGARLSRHRQPQLPAVLRRLGRRRGAASARGHRDVRPGQLDRGIVPPKLRAGAHARTSRCGCSTRDPDKRTASQQARPGPQRPCVRRKNSKQDPAAALAATPPADASSAESLDVS